MQGFENPIYLVAYILSNVVAVLILYTAITHSRLSRILLIVLFGWASWINYTTVHKTPAFYLDYAPLAASWYADFILGWFRNHIAGMVTLISVGQALITLGLILKGWWVKIACAGAIVFLLCIAPLGIGSAFPFSFIVSVAIYFILKKDNLDYVWVQNKKRK